MLIFTGFFIQMHQAGGAAIFERILRNQFFWQIIVKI